MADKTHNDWATTARRDGPAGSDRASRDPAAESLAHALHLSFRLLTVIMIVIVVAFLLTGIRQIKPGQAGIIYRFGRIVDVAGRGLCYAWPFPVGDIEVVDISPKDLRVDDFWMAETAEDKTVERLIDRQVRGNDGLRPAWDGALVTGDGNLIHVRFECNYQIGSENGMDPDESLLLDHKLNVNDLDLKGRAQTKDLLRSVICQAAIRTAGGQTAESIRRNQEVFWGAVHQDAQDVLGELDTGIKINLLTMEFTWPLRVLPQVEAATKARQEAEKQLNAAIAEARRVLVQTAGDKYWLLVGKTDGDGNHADTSGQSAGPGLIALYADAVAARQTDEAAKRLAEIQRVLVSDQIAGQVRPIIDQAKAETYAMLDALDGRLTRFRELLPEYRRNREFVIQRLWADARDAILSSATIEKYYFSPGDGKLVIKLDRHPDVVKQVREGLLKRAAGGPQP